MLLNKQDYLNEMDNLLSDKETYTILKRDPTNLYKKAIEYYDPGGIQKGYNY